MQPLIEWCGCTCHPGFQTRPSPAAKSAKSKKTINLVWFGSKQLAELTPAEDPHFAFFDSIIGFIDLAWAVSSMNTSEGLFSEPKVAI